MPKNKTVSEYLRYTFTPHETTENAQSLARRNRAFAEHQLRKKQLAADLKTQEEALNEEIARLSRYVTDGYDFRMVECTVIFNSPKTGLKEIVRLDTGELVRTDKMSPAELQDELPLSEAS